MSWPRSSSTLSPELLRANAGLEAGQHIDIAIIADLSATAVIAA